MSEEYKDNSKDIVYCDILHLHRFQEDHQRKNWLDNIQEWNLLHISTLSLQCPVNIDITHAWINEIVNCEYVYT